MKQMLPALFIACVPAAFVWHFHDFCSDPVAHNVSISEVALADDQPSMADKAYAIARMDEYDFTEDYTTEDNLIDYVFHEQNDTFVCVYEVRHQTTCGYPRMERKTVTLDMSFLDKPDTLQGVEALPVIYDRNEWELNVYPNPMSDQATLHIDGELDENYQFEVYDLSGKRVFYEAGLRTPQYQFYRNGLPAGLYVYRVISASELHVHSGKMVLQ